jgi:predicted oxidoreductase
MDPAETGLALDNLIKLGKIKAIGDSNFRPWDVALVQSHMKNPM